MAGRPRKISEEFKGYTTRDAILAAAEKLCGEQGTSGLKIREVARRVGIEPASIYNHFNGLDGLLASLISEALAEEHKLLDLPQGLHGSEAIQELNRRTTRFLADRKGIVRLCLNDFAEVHDQNPNAFDDNEALIVRGLDIESDLIGRHVGLQALGRAKLGQIAIARRSMILVYLSVTWLNKREVDAVREREIVDLVSAFVLGLSSQLGKDVAQR